VSVASPAPTVAVIGAGPAGMTAAYLLARRGVPVEVFEKAATVGGLARSFQLWGHTVDLGPHRFFSHDPRVNQLWLEVVGRDYRMVDRLTRIYYRRRFFRYPLDPVDALVNMGLGDAAACLLSYAAEALRPSRPSGEDSFEAWVVRRFGRRLFDMFFRSYSEKLWGIPCSELGAEFAAQRIKRFSLGEALKRALGLGDRRHATLVDRFAYPTGGTGMVYERMAERVRQSGGRVHLATGVRRVLRDGQRVNGLELEDGCVRRFGHVISTMPLTRLVRELGDLPADVETAVTGLRFRNTVFVYMHVRPGHLFADQWIYVHSPELGLGRVTNFANWVPEIRGHDDSTVLVCEYWCDDGEPRWREPADDVAARAAGELQATGLLAGAAILASKVVKVAQVYPVYARGFQARLGTIVCHLQAFDGLTAIGRGGAFKYNNQDHSILMGILAVENLLDRGRHDLWALNSDQEYQEAATITEAGLERVR